ncbi:DUF3185 family protein [Wenzhouxiangella sp. XN79A]|uniref:DUF3185 family protein n=1 Tax=Wenzhouxiangella sp. XN79A TaxID=2724193 RepID=UPI00144A9D5E|nr:DUF3185 family protein [Wenzhouxiangella sp. XN79A]
MPKNRFLGVLLLAGGLYLLWMALQVADRTGGGWYSQVMTGAISDQALLYGVAGIVLSAVGLAMARRR